MHPARIFSCSIRRPPRLVASPAGWSTRCAARSTTAGSPGSRLPATTLANDLAVSRGVIVEAYRRLTDEGLVSGCGGGGTTILAGPAVRRATPAKRPSPLGLPRLPAQLPVGEGVDLSPGVPDLSVPAQRVARRARRFGRDATGRPRLWRPARHPRLRAALAPWLARTRGLRVSPDDILVVSRVAQAFALIAQQLRRDRIDSIAVEDPGSRGAVAEFAYWGFAPSPFRWTRMASSGLACGRRCPRRVPYARAPVSDGRGARAAAAARC